MIPCPLCGFVNPLGTRFCRGCGEKVETKMSMVTQSVALTKQSDRESALIGMGKSALSVGGFLLIAALIFRNTLVPDMPAPDLPPVTVASLVPDAMLHAPMHDSAASANARLTWRLNQGPALLKDVGVDIDHVHAWQDDILKAQKDDGAFTGSDQLLATALAALALQAVPTNDGLAAAARARAWLKPLAAKDLGSRPALTRSLVLTAFADAEDMPPELWAVDKGYLIDSQAPVWQATGVALLPAKDRRVNHDQLRGVNTDALWTAWWDAIDSKPVDNPVAVPASAFAAVDPTTLAAGEDRLMFMQEEWFLVGDPDDIRKNLDTWSRTDPAPVDASLLAKTGPWAPEAVAVLTVASPLRMPPLALSAP